MDQLLSIRERATVLETPDYSVTFTAFGNIPKNLPASKDLEAGAERILEIFFR